MTQVAIGNWSVDTWRQDAIARKARLMGTPLRAVPPPAPPKPAPTALMVVPKFKKAATIYQNPIGPRPHTHMYEYPIGPRQPPYLCSDLRPMGYDRFEPQSFEEMTAMQLLSYTCVLRGMPESLVCGPQRNADIVRVRQEAMHLMCSVGFYSLPEIGRRVGGRDHTTVLHAKRKVMDLIERGLMEPTPFDPEIAARVCRGSLRSRRVQMKSMA